MTISKVHIYISISVSHISSVWIFITQSRANFFWLMSYYFCWKSDSEPTIYIPRLGMYLVAQNWISPSKVFNKYIYIVTQSRANFFRLISYYFCWKRNSELDKPVWVFINLYIVTQCRAKPFLANVLFFLLKKWLWTG